MDPVWLDFGLRVHERSHRHSNLEPVNVGKYESLENLQTPQRIDQRDLEDWA